MTNRGLAARLNAQLGLTGNNAVTPNIIRQWVSWEVLPKSTAKGRSLGRSPSWSRSTVALRRARRLAELRILGVRRESALIVQAYIEWGYPDFDRVRGAMLREIRKWRSQLLRRRTTQFGNTEYENLSVVQKRAIRTQLGPLDCQFIGTQFEQSDELYAAYTRAAERGEIDAIRQFELLRNALSRISPEIADLVPDNAVTQFQQMVAGLFGSPDEISNSAESEIEAASKQEFEAARRGTRKILFALHQSEKRFAIAKLPNSIRELIAMLSALGPQISVGPWTVFQFAQLILRVRRTDGSEIAVNEADLTKIMRLISS